jgi:hypothetical protein
VKEVAAGAPRSSDRVGFEGVAHVTATTLVLITSSTPFDLLRMSPGAFECSPRKLEVT